jgi:hypothetical protein
MTISAERFRQQPLARQLGALAANLARISTCSRWTEPADILIPMLTESIQFVEWVAPYTSPEIASELVDLQIMLGLWRKSWPHAQPNGTQRTLLSFQAKKWSDQIIDFSGLLDSE